MWIIWKCYLILIKRKKKEKYVILVRALKQALNHGLKLKEVHRVIQFNQKTCLKPNIYMNTKSRKEAKKIFFWEGFL